MARYINEDEFIAWVREHWCLDCQNDCGLRCRACWIDDAIDIVEEAPAADVAPRSEVERLERLRAELSKEVADLQDALKCEKETNAHLCGEYLSAKTEVAREIFNEILDGLQYEIDIEDKQGRAAWENGDTTAHQIHQYAEEKLETISLAISVFAKIHGGAE